MLKASLLSKRNRFFPIRRSFPYLSYYVKKNLGFTYKIYIPTSYTRLSKLLYLKTIFNNLYANFLLHENSYYSMPQIPLDSAVNVGTVATVVEWSPILYILNNFIYFNVSHTFFPTFYRFLRVKYYSDLIGSSSLLAWKSFKRNFDKRYQRLVRIESRYYFVQILQYKRIVLFFNYILYYIAFRPLVGFLIDYTVSNSFYVSDVHGYLAHKLLGNLTFWSRIFLIWLVTSYKFWRLFIFLFKFYLPKILLYRRILQRHYHTFIFGGFKYRKFIFSLNAHSQLFGSYKLLKYIWRYSAHSVFAFRFKFLMFKKFLFTRRRYSLQFFGFRIVPPVANIHRSSAITKRQIFSRLYKGRNTSLSNYALFIWAVNKFYLFDLYREVFYLEKLKSSQLHLKLFTIFCPIQWVIHEEPFIVDIYHYFRSMYIKFNQNFIISSLMFLFYKDFCVILFFIDPIIYYSLLPRLITILITEEFFLDYEEYCADIFLKAKTFVYSAARIDKSIVESFKSGWLDNSESILTIYGLCTLLTKCRLQELSVWRRYNWHLYFLKRDIYNVCVSEVT